MNIIFVIADTLRRDHVGCYGNRHIRTPNIDKFAQEAAVFDHAYECSFPTMPTRADHFTGKLTFAFMCWEPLPKDEIVLSQHLNEAGYNTMGVVDTPFYIRHYRQEMNYDRGFQDFIWVRGQGPEPELSDYNKTRAEETDHMAPRTFIEAERWLERNHKKEPFFLLIDTWDPHEPWDPPAYYVEPYWPGYDGEECKYPVYGKYRGRVTKKELDLAHACYCGEITMVDFWFGRLMQRLESLDLLDNTAIIFTTDHGFYFGEHGYFGKGERSRQGWMHSPLYDEISRIPLLIRAPGAKAQRIPTLVSQPDLMPTILDMAGVKPPKGIYGKSLLPLMRGSKKPRHNIVITAWPLYGPGVQATRAVDAVERMIKEHFASTIFDGEWTLLYTAEGGPAELYHTKRDPRQKNNLFKKNRKKALELHGKYIEELKKAGTDERLLRPRLRL